MKILKTIVAISAMAIIPAAFATKTFQLTLCNNSNIDFSLYTTLLDHVNSPTLNGAPLTTHSKINISANNGCHDVMGWDVRDGDTGHIAFNPHHYVDKWYNAPIFVHSRAKGFSGKLWFSDTEPYLVIKHDKHTVDINIQRSVHDDKEDGKVVFTVR